MKTILIFSLILSLWLAPSLLLAQDTSQAFIEPPDTLEGLKSMILKAWQAFPNAFKAAFEEAREFWHDLANWLRNWWANNWADRASAWLNRLWDKLKALFLQREDIFKQEFGKEKEEMKTGAKEELPELQKSFLERFKEIIQ